MPKDGYREIAVLGSGCWIRARLQATPTLSLLIHTTLNLR